MSVKDALLALLDDTPSYGYQLKADFEAAAGGAWALNIGQVYTSLQRLERDGLVESDEARSLKLQDAERSLSRVHAEIRLIDWDVYIVDRGSANGTYVLPRGAQQWKRLVADAPEKILPGTRVAFGKRVVTYESHHQINQAAV